MVQDRYKMTRAISILERLQNDGDPFHLQELERTYAAYKSLSYRIFLIVGQIKKKR